ncbi:MAG: hypothetical protein H6924_04410 [Alphaproteobacteria bacterium]|nr:hypothetical protein [Alphaproteobacteria bacterium]
MVAAILLLVLFRQQEPPKPAARRRPHRHRKSRARRPRPPGGAHAAMPPLDRRALIDGARASGAALAATGELPPPDAALGGRKFAIRIPFGCNGLQIGASPSQASLSYDADNKSMTLSAQPNVWTQLSLVQGLPNLDDIDAVEGFWIPRPWSYSDSCPPRVEYPAVVTPTPPTAQTLGLARFFGKGDSRVLQHADHPFTFTRKLPDGDLSALNHGYILLLSGRIGSYQDGRALHCWMEASDHHPICLYSVIFDHIAFEDASTGETLAEWNE